MIKLYSMTLLNCIQLNLIILSDIPFFDIVIFLHSPNMAIIRCCCGVLNMRINITSSTCQNRRTSMNTQLVLSIHLGNKSNSNCFIKLSNQMRNIKTFLKEENKLILWYCAKSKTIRWINYRCS
jgi:hypothetical protein